MYRVRIEQLLGSVYCRLLADYQQEGGTDHYAQLFRRYVSPEVWEAFLQQSLAPRSMHDFTTAECHPTGWAAPIRLYVNVYEVLEVYFDSPVDLMSYVDTLVTDPPFLDLARVALFITRELRPWT